MYVWMFSLRVNRSLVKTWDVKVWFDPTKTAIGAKIWRETKERERCTRNRESRRSCAARRATKIPAIFSLVEIGDSSQCKSNRLIKVELLFQKIKNSHFERTLFFVVVACSRRLLGRNVQNCGVRETSPLLFYFVFFSQPIVFLRPVPSHLVPANWEPGTNYCLLLLFSIAHL